MSLENTTIGIIRAIIAIITKAVTIVLLRRVAQDPRALEPGSRGVPDLEAAHVLERYFT